VKKYQYQLIFTIALVLLLGFALLFSQQYVGSPKGQYLPAPSQSRTGSPIASLSPSPSRIPCPEEPYTCSAKESCVLGNNQNGQVFYFCEPAKRLNCEPGERSCGGQLCCSSEETCVLSDGLYGCAEDSRCDSMGDNYEDCPVYPFCCSDGEDCVATFTPAPTYQCVIP